MSLDNAIYVVSRSTGEYSDRIETPVVAFVERESAERFVKDAEAQAREAEARFPIDYTTYDDKPAMDGRRSVMTLDPDGADPYEQPFYFFCDVPLFTRLASAGEADRPKRGETRGSVHEHATREAGDAQ